VSKRVALLTPARPARSAFAYSHLFPPPVAGPGFTNRPLGKEGHLFTDDTQALINAVAAGLAEQPLRPKGYFRGSKYVVVGWGGRSLGQRSRSTAARSMKPADALL